jgi:hypothetical protein
LTVFEKEVTGELNHLLVVVLRNLTPKKALDGTTLTGLDLLG